jgi:hypothetical protein
MWTQSQRLGVSYEANRPTTTHAKARAAYAISLLASENWLGPKLVSFLHLLASMVCARISNVAGCDL